MNSSGAAESGLAPWQRDGAGFEAVEDPAQALFALPRPVAAFAASGTPEEALDRVVTVTHDVPIAPGQTLRLNEHFTLRGWLRQPRRAVLFLSSAFSRGDLWSIPVAGYDGTRMAAERGFFAFTADYLGIGDSYRPADGLESTFTANAAALATALRFIRFFRAVERVDLVGESWGAAHATQLAADAERVRSCAVCTATYRVAARPEFLAPEYEAFLRGLPDHYLPMGPEFFTELTTGAPAEVTDWACRTQPGKYLVTHFLQSIAGMPHFDPSVARVPGLVISGSEDRPEDGRELAEVYGAEARHCVIPDAGHGPRLETPRSAEIFWREVFEFLESESAH